MSGVVDEDVYDGMEAGRAPPLQGALRVMK
jgi:hypothetical protein